MKLILIDKSNWLIETDWQSFFVNNFVFQFSLDNLFWSLECVAVYDKMCRCSGMISPKIIKSYISIGI